MKTTQNQRLLNYLKANGCINPIDAWLSLGIYRLSARIHDLRKDHDIQTKKKTVLNRFKEKVTVANYTMQADEV